MIAKFFQVVILYFTVYFLKKQQIILINNVILSDNNEIQPVYILCIFPSILNYYFTKYQWTSHGPSESIRSSYTSHEPRYKGKVSK